MTAAQYSEVKLTSSIYRRGTSARRGFAGTRKQDNWYRRSFPTWLTGERPLKAFKVQRAGRNQLYLWSVLISLPRHLRMNMIAHWSVVRWVAFLGGSLDSAFLEIQLPFVLYPKNCRTAQSYLIHELDPRTLLKFAMVKQPDDERTNTVLKTMLSVQKTCSVHW